MNKLLQTDRRYSAFLDFLRATVVCLVMLFSISSKSNAQTGSWTTLGTDNAISQNGGADYPTLVVVEEQGVMVPYVFFNETSVGAQVKRRKTDGSWELVGATLTTSAQFTSIWVDNNHKIYISFVDVTAGFKVAVKTLNASRNGWDSVGGDYVSTNSDWGGHANMQLGAKQSMAFDSSNRPYIAYTEKDHDNVVGSNIALVKRLNGSVWETLGNGPVSTDRASSVNLAIDQNDTTVYLAYVSLSTTTSTTGSLKVTKFASGSWSQIAAPTTASTNVRTASVVVDGEGNLVYAYAGGNLFGNKYTRSGSGGTWGTEFRISGNVNVVNWRMVRNHAGDAYFSILAGSAINSGVFLYKLLNGTALSSREVLNPSDELGGIKYNVSIGPDNKEYIARARPIGTVTSSTTSPSVIHVKVYEAPVRLLYTGLNKVCSGGGPVTLSSTSSGANNRWFKNGTIIDGATDPTYSVTESGIYHIKLSTGATTFSQSSNSVTITISTPPTATITPAGGSTTISAGGSVVLSANAGTGYTYQWTKDGADIDGATSADYTATTAGSYQVKVTSGCTTLSAATVVTVDSTPVPTISYTGATTFCDGGSLVLTSSATSGNQWKKDGVAITNETNQTYTVTTAGSYTVTTGTTTSTALNVVVNSNPTAAVTASGSLVIGGGGSVVLTANAGTGYTFQWTKDGVNIDGATTGDYIASTVGAYRVKVTLGSCTTVSDASNVTDSTPVPTISYTGATTFCQGENLVLTSSASNGNQWNKDGVAITNASSSTYTVTASGSYTVTTGPTTSTAVNVLVNPTPTATVTASGSLVLASGGSVVLTANAGTGYTFQWTKDGADINAAINADYIATTAGSYRVKVTSNGCITVSDASVVSAATTISYTGATTFCQGGNLVLTSSASSGNQWYKDGVAITNATGSTYTVTASGSYTVSAGSTTSTAVNVIVNPSPTATVTANGSLVIATGGNVVLTTNAGTGYTFQWTKDGADINTATNANYTATTAGSFRVKVTSGGCTTLSEASVVTAAPTISYTGATTFCQGGSLVLTSSASSGNQWYKGGVAISNANSSTYTVASSGNYTVNTGSIHSTEVNIVVNPIPTATITASGPLQFTQGGNVVLSANTGTGFTYQWSKDGADINAATNVTYTATTPGLYRVKISQSGCTGTSSPSTIIYIPTISYSGAPTVCQGQTVVLTSSASIGNQWFKDGVSITGANAATYTAAASGTYSVTAQGSLASSGVLVTVNPLPVSAITAQGPVLFKTGGSVVLSAGTGSGYTYKWFRNGTVINGAADATYTAAEGGSYTLVTTSNSCSVTSSAVEVSSVFALPTNNFGVSVTGESCKISNDGKILIAAAQNLNYTATLVNNGTATAFPFTSSLQIPNLSAGTYSLCISVDGQTGFAQCYDNLVVVEPNDLSLYSSVNESNQTITLSLAGGKNYNIKINGVNHTTTKSNITLPLLTGENKIVVTADSECQGVVEKLVTLNDRVLIYPNPFEDILSLKLNNERSSKASIQIKSLIGALVYTKNFSSTDNINLELSHLPSGAYLLKLSLDNSDSFYKVIKR